MSALWITDDLYNKCRLALLDELKKHSVKFGDFTLRSGKKSDFYVDCRPVVLTPYGLQFAGAVIGYNVWQKFGTLDTCGTGVGGSYLSAASALSVGGYIIHVRDSKKEHGTKKKVELPANFNDIIEVVVVDDVLTTGSSLAVCLDALKEANIKAAGCLVLVDREEGGKETIEDTYKIPVKSVFVKSDFNNYQ